MTIADKIKELKEKYPYKTALVDLKTGDKANFNHMDVKSDKICTYLEKKGFKKGDKIVVFVPIGVEFYLILLAIFKMGLQAVFIDPYADTEHINKCCEMISPEGIIGSGKTILKGFFLKGIRKIGKKINYNKMLDQSEGLSPMKKRKPKKYEREEEQINENTPALISFTSGSTGFPKIITRTHGFLMGQHKVLEKNLKFEKETSIYSSFPIFLLSHMATGATVFIPDIDMSSPMEANPKEVTEQIRKNNIQNIILPPVILENIVNYAEKNNIILKNVQTVYTGGAPVFPKLMQKVDKVFENAKVRALYGASEAEPISILNYEDITGEDIENMKNGYGLLVGKKVDEIDLKIEEISEKADEEMNESKNEDLEKKSEAENKKSENKEDKNTGIKGEILVKGENVLKGYLNVPESSEKKWHKTGDTGYINEKGQLVLLGRVKGRIRINDNIYYPFSIETAFSFCEALKKSVLTSKDDKLYLIVERNPDFEGNLEENEEIKKLKEKFGIFKIVEDEIPVDKRHNSKTDYKKLEELKEKL